MKTDFLKLTDTEYRQFYSSFLIENFELIDSIIECNIAKDKLIPFKNKIEVYFVDRNSINATLNYHS